MSWAIWITGRPAGGKTTLAVRVARAVRAWRDAAREWIEHLAEVQLVCPPEVCVRRERAARWRSGARRGAGAAVAPRVALDCEESLHPELRLHTRTRDFRSAVENVLLLARRLHRAATATVTQAERTVR